MFNFRKLKLNLLNRNMMERPYINNSVNTSVTQSDGKILIGGSFTNYEGTANRNCLIRFNADKTLDTAFCTNAADASKISGSVLSIALQSDGKILVGGTFTSYAGTTGRDNFIRLNSDGTLDTAFCANATDSSKFTVGGGNGVSCITVQADGKILVGGGFLGYAGTAGRSYCVRLNSDGTTDTAFCANATDSNKFNNPPMQMVMQSDTKIIICGGFGSYLVAGRNFFIRLTSTGTLDTAFCANASDGSKIIGDISAAALQSDGKIIVGGNVSNYASTAGRSRLLRFNSDGTLDTAFCANATDGTKFNSAVYGVALQSDGKIAVSGAFTAYAGTTGRDRLIRLNSDGTLDTAFCTNASDGSKFDANTGSIYPFFQSSGKILLGGTFTNYAGATGRNYFISLSSNGTLDTTDILNVQSIYKFSSLSGKTAVQSDGKILVCGSFTNYEFVSGRNNLVRLNADGTTDTAFCINAVDGSKFSSTVNSVVVQTDGKILVGGSFTNYGTSGRNNLIRLNSDGTLDTAFCVNASNGTKFSTTVSFIALQSDGKILVSGSFINYAGTTGRSFFIRLNSDGTTDTAFCINATDGTKFATATVSIAVQADGKILTGFNFLTYGGTTGRARLVRLNSDGTLDTAFCVNAVDGTKFSSAVQSIAVQSDGKILIGGNFLNYGTSTRNNFIRLNSDGTTDTTFCANATDGTKFNTFPSFITVQSNGKILLSGSFTNYAGTTGRNRLIRLNSDGTTDNNFCANVSDGSKLTSLLSVIDYPADGKLLATGAFTVYKRVGSKTLSCIFKITQDGLLK